MATGGSGDRAGLTLTCEPLDVRAIEESVAHPTAGAICTFAGIVRNHHQGRPVDRLRYDCYPQMAAAKLAAIRDEIHRRWPGSRCALAHRTGTLEVGEVSVVVVVSAPHRDDAFAACRHGIERIKQEVPIWKQEFHGGEGRWL